jgi:hypothetical protein
VPEVMDERQAIDLIVQELTTSTIEHTHREASLIEQCSYNNPLGLPKEASHQLLRQGGYKGFLE